MPVDRQATESKTLWNRRALDIARFLVLTGIILRLAFLVQNQSFWQDEIAVALAFDEGAGSFYRTLEALESYNQIAPVAYLASVKASVAVLGHAEWCYRLVPFIASVFGLFLMLRLAQTCLAPTAGLLAIGIIAMSPRLVDYASELKPYSCDQAIATATLLMALLAYRGDWNRRHLTALAGFGIVAPWFSFPSTISLAVVGAIVCVATLRKRRWWTVMLALATGCAWIACFAAEYRLVKTVAESEYMVSFWSDCFMPFPPRSCDDVLWVPSSLRSLFVNPLKTSVPAIALVICLIGWWRCCWPNRSVGVLLVGPVILTMAISATHMYPFGNRLAQFLCPALAIGLALGFEWFLRSAKRWHRYCGVVLFLTCFIEPTAWVAKHAMLGREKENPRHVLQYISTNRRDGDVLYHSVHSELSVRYYGPRFSLQDVQWLRGYDVQFDRDATVLRTFGNRRVWFYFGHARKHDVESFLSEINRRGLQVDSVVCVGSSAYLYNMQNRRAESN